ANVEEAARQDLDACFLERAAGRLLVVDDEPEVRFLRARPPLEQGEELVAHPEERGAGDAAHRRGLEEVGVERDRLVDVVDLQRDVIDSDETWLHAATNDGAPARMPGRGATQTADAPLRSPTCLPRRALPSRPPSSRRWHDWARSGRRVSATSCSGSATRPIPSLRSRRGKWRSSTPRATSSSATARTASSAS